VTVSGKIHTIAKNDHAQNVQAKQYGIDLNAPVADPLTNRGAYGLAQQAAALQYDPQINQAKQAGANSQAWFQNYLNEVTERQTAAQQYAAPILQQSQQWANATPTAAPGFDPNAGGAAVPAGRELERPEPRAARVHDARRDPRVREQLLRRARDGGGSAGPGR
jgi:hypothetical protein